MTSRTHHARSYIGAQRGMAIPLLGLSTCFDSWKAQLTAYYVFKDIKEENQLKILPLSLSQEILQSVLKKLEAKTKLSLKAALEEIEAVWLRLSKPANPAKTFCDVTINSPSEAEKARTELGRLAKYIGFDDSAVAKQMIQAVPSSIRPTVQAYASSKDKHPSSSDMAAFISVLPFPEMSGSTIFKVRDERRACRICSKTNHPTYKCFQIQCYNCKEKGHIARNCPKNT